MNLRKWLSMWVVVGVCASVSFTYAQGGMPTFTGKGKVTDAIDGDKGAIFDIGGGITMLFPKGIPVGHSRLVTLQKSRKRPAPAQIHAKFKAIGSALLFDGAFNTAGKPIVLSMPSKRDPGAPGRRLVVAVEIATFCGEKNKRYKLKNGLCSGWEFEDAEYIGGRLVGKLQSTGGMRLQFGSLPEDAE